MAQPFKLVSVYCANKVTAQSAFVVYMGWVGAGVGTTIE